MPTAIAALLNGRARKVTPGVVRALAQALPGSTVLVSGDFDQARRHVRELIRQRPDVILSGGGDGAAMRLMNFWREEGGGELPAIGILRLGTGNGWARALGAPPFFRHVRRLSRLRDQTLPMQEFPLVEVENHLCQFAGVGWDARILNDYQRNLDKRSSQLVGSRMASWLHKGARGYLYSVARITIPEEWARLHQQGHAQVALENLGPEVFALSDGKAVPLPAPSLLHEGPISVGAASTVAEWGYGLRAFPHARLQPGFINVRIYDGHVLHAVLNAPKLWRGVPVAGLYDWFATAVRMRFSRPMPFQIGGDAMGERSEIVLRKARETVRMVDWRAAFAAL
ncbi:MAG TPA: diacylglycerol kinase family protein [Myxococcales bacterium]|nr:diacylglycerol kinase family protein [Myxococcales bacterium]